MTIDKLQRVMQRLGSKGGVVLRRDIRKAIMKEIGTDERTITRTIDKLKELDYVKRKGPHIFELTWESDF